MFTIFLSFNKKVLMTDTVVHATDESNLDLWLQSLTVQLERPTWLLLILTQRSDVTETEARNCRNRGKSMADLTWEWLRFHREVMLRAELWIAR